MHGSYGASWSARGDHSPLTTPRQPLRDFYIAERAARAQAFLAVIARVFALALRLCFETILVSAGDVFVSAGLCSLCSRLWSGLWSLLSLPAFCSSLCSASVSSLPRLRLSFVAWPSTNGNYN